MNRWFRVGLAVLVGVLAAAVPFGYKSIVGTKYRNFRVVEPGVLYRSGQMSPAGFQTIAQEYGLRTVVSLREVRDGDDGKPSPDRQEAEWCRANGVKHITLSPMVWRPAGDQPPPVEANLREFFRVMDDPAARPVLIHCFAGIHRTGGYVGLYRIEYDGWPADAAIAEMKSMGTPRTTFDDEIPDYLRAYVRGRLRPGG